MKKLACAALFALLACQAWAEQTPDEGKQAESLPMEITDEEGNVIEPEVTIREEQGRTVQEYRINGQLYMVKITPARGPAYYLMDTDGDGEFDQTTGEDPARIVVPQWILFRW